MTSKERSELISAASALTATCQIGREGLTPQVTESISEGFNTRELIKINVQKNCIDDLRELAQTAAERTHSEVVTVIGRKLVLYKKFTKTK